MRRRLFDGRAPSQCGEGLLAGRQAVLRSRHTPPGQHGQRASAQLADAAPHDDPIMFPVVGLAASASMTDDGVARATRTLTRQPLAFLLLGVAPGRGTWDKDNHWQRRPAQEWIPGKATHSQASPSLLSNRICAEKESHLDFFPIGRFSHHKNLSLSCSAESATYENP